LISMMPSAISGTFELEQAPDEVGVRARDDDRTRGPSLRTSTRWRGCGRRGEGLAADALSLGR
jgi:hypothetical protein